MLFRQVAGPDGVRHRERIHGTPGPRWFGPDAAIVRVHGDAAMFVGGIRAVLLQTLHPAAMTAVAEHSGYRGDMWGRLARTSRYLATTTFGTIDHAERTIAAVRAVHARVTGQLPDGSAYAASDPHLLGWVHVAEIESFLLAHQLYGARPLDQAGCDAYVDETGQVAARLGVVDPPRTEAEMRAVMAGYRPELRGTDHAREAVDYLIRHPELPLMARPAYRGLVAAAVALLPRLARAELGLPDFPLVDRTLGRALGRAGTTVIRWAMTAGQAHAGELARGRPGGVRGIPRSAGETST